MLAEDIDITGRNERNPMPMLTEQQITEEIRNELNKHFATNGYGAELSDYLKLLRDQHPAEFADAYNQWLAPR